jgi:hypothetical protein
VSGGSPRAAGSLVGLVVFIAGAGLVAWSFWLAWGVFSRPPEVAMRLQPDQPMDFGAVVAGLFEVVAKAVMLVVMAGIGSVLANRGVRLYSESGGLPKE